MHLTTGAEGAECCHLSDICSMFDARFNLFALVPRSNLLLERLTPCWRLTTLAIYQHRRRTQVADCRTCRRKLNALSRVGKRAVLCKSHTAHIVHQTSPAGCRISTDGTADQDQERERHQSQPRYPRYEPAAVLPCFPGRPARLDFRAVRSPHQKRSASFEHPVRTTNCAAAHHPAWQ